ncbi:hypothetical protein OR16_02360 [Cupriavidus basilensis OR16]|uniref:DUF1254 domain-containing protein n=1 Tax=Cupriavidus basilensis OR16 TaxID=1127483 RepID=H1RYW4_9BURK|nr:DUF1254 domain-containing protein [Cupriavidus basilensis]EHP44495.1 hypothetical protein OR16_02360 [Cupriavidus basilensis OR16]
MIISLRRIASALALGLLLSACVTGPQTSAVPQPAPPSSNGAIKALSAQIFVYAYPLVLMDVTREVMTARVPANSFSHKRSFPDATFTDVVSPNADTLYSTAWLDLSAGPVILSLPDTRGRYYLMPLMDAWTNVFASPGKRTTGTRKAVYAVTGPMWNGVLPPGVTEIRSPTEMVWLIGRTQTNGKQDYAAVRRLQDQYRLAPLSALQRGGKVRAKPDLAMLPEAVPVDVETPPVEQVAAMDAQAFFSRFAELLPANPPAAADAAMVEAIKKFGIVPGMPFSVTALEPSTARAVQEGATTALAGIVAMARRGGGEGDGKWTVHRDLGSYGTAYGKRALVAWVGLGANLPADALYPSTRVDAAGKPLNGANRYVMHFDKGQMPPSAAFWSLTLYNDKQAFVANPLNRYAIGDRDRLRYNRDGSLDIYIQNARPEGKRVANWLPAPPDGFNLMMRVYWPRRAMLEGTWSAPPVVRAD